MEKARPAPPPDGVRDGKAMREAMTVELQTFASESFHASAFATPPAGAPARGVRGHVQGLVDVVAAVTPQLDAAQRDKLAVRLEEGPPRMGGKKGGRRAPAAK